MDREKDKDVFMEGERVGDTDGETKDGDVCTEKGDRQKDGDTCVEEEGDKDTDPDGEKDGDVCTEEWEEGGTD